MAKEHITQTLHAYNHHAEAYLKKFANFSAYAEKMHYFQKQYISTGASILDVGCGPGITARLLKEADPTCTITGVDFSEKMIRLAQKHVPQVIFLVQDIRELKVTGYFDAIIASFCIVHLLQEEAALLIAQLARMQKPAGVLYLSFMEQKGKKGSGYESTSFSTDHIYFNYYNSDWVQQQLVANGYKMCKVLSCDYPEQDGSVTTDIFIFAQKNAPNKQDI